HSFLALSPHQELIAVRASGAGGCREGAVIATWGGEAMSTRWLVVVVFAWVLWVDQTSYTLPNDPTDPTPRQAEGATSRWQQLAVTQTRGQCQALLQTRVQDAARADAALDQANQSPGLGRARYRDQYRYFCSPIVDGSKK